MKTIIETKDEFIIGEGKPEIITELRIKSSDKTLKEIADLLRFSDIDGEKVIGFLETFKANLKEIVCQN